MLTKPETPETPEKYIAQLPIERQEVITTFHNLILEHMPKGLESGISYGMLAYYVPKSIYPKGYHCKPNPALPFINLASQKNYIALYHAGLYANKNLYDWFVKAFPKYSTNKLDMGKSCIRFKKIDAIPFNLIKKLLSKMSVEQWITTYEKSL